MTTLITFMNRELSLALVDKLLNSNTEIQQGNTIYISRHDLDPVQETSEDYDKHQIEGRNAWKHTKNLHNYKGKRR